MKPFSLYLIVSVCCLILSCKSEIQLPTISDQFKITQEGLSCNHIVMENYTGVVDASEAMYGEKITLFYNDMRGFTLQDGKAHPNMDIYLIDKKGDTLLKQENLFEGVTDGYKEKDGKLILHSDVTFARPLLPNNTYRMHAHITDKNNSDAFYHVERNFSITHDPEMNVKKDGISYDIMYIYSMDRNLSVIDHKISVNEKVYLLMEGLEGYEIDEEGKADISANMSLKHADGTIITEIKDLFPNKVSAKDLKEQLYASIIITEKETGEEPVTCTFQMKDKISGKSLETNFKLYVH